MSPSCSVDGTDYQVFDRVPGECPVDGETTTVEVRYDPSSPAVSVPDEPHPAGMHDRRGPG